MRSNENNTDDPLARVSNLPSPFSPTTELPDRNGNYSAYNETLNNLSTDGPNTYGSPEDIAIPLNYLGNQQLDFSAVFGTNPLGGWDMYGMEIPFSTPTDNSDPGIGLSSLLDNAGSGSGSAHAQIPLPIPGFLNGGTNLNYYSFNTASALNFQEP